jgi:hypothetical protein
VVGGQAYRSEKGSLANNWAADEGMALKKTAKMCVEAVLTDLLGIICAGKEKKNLEVERMHGAETLAAAWT